MDFTVRIDREMLLVIGLWLGVGRVGVLKGPLFAEWGGGVDGRGGVPNSSRSRSSPSGGWGVPARPGAIFSSLPVPVSFCIGKFGPVWTTFTSSSPRTFGIPSFLGDGKRRRRIAPRSSSTAMGLSAAPLPLERDDPGRFWFGEPSKLGICLWGGCENCLSSSSPSSGMVFWRGDCDPVSPPSRSNGEGWSPGPNGSVVKYASEVGFSCASLLVRDLLERELLLLDSRFLRGWFSRAASLSHLSGGR